MPAAAGPVALEDLDRRRLAGAVGAQQPEHLAAGDRDVDPADGLVLAVALGQAAHLDRGGVAHDPAVWLDGAGGVRYQCTPLVSVAIAICSKETCSSVSWWWPFEAAESGNTR